MCTEEKIRLALAILIALAVIVLISSPIKKDQCKYEVHCNDE